jgi:hypothetical protein
MTSKLGSKMPPLADRQMWALWRDFFISSKTWRMKTPIGVLAFSTKKAALASRAYYEKTAGTGSLF